MSLVDQFNLGANAASATPGNNVLVYYQTPTAGATTTAGATLAGYFDMPNVDIDEGAHQGWGGGSREPLFEVVGALAPTASLAMKLADTAFAAKCFGDGTGPFGVPNMDIFAGAKATNSYLGFMDKLVEAYCNTVSLAIQNRNGAEVNLSAELWAKDYAQGITVPSAPSLAALEVFGPPMTNMSLTAFEIAPNGGTPTDLLPCWMGIDVSRRHNLERCCPQGSTGLFGFTKPHNQEDSFSAQLYVPRIPDVLAYGGPTGGGVRWGNGTVPAVRFALSNGVHTFSWQALYAAVGRRTMQGGDIGGEWDGQLVLLPRGVTVGVS